jgi:hypothetical protein
VTISSAAMSVFPELNGKAHREPGLSAIRWSRLLDAFIKIVSIDFLHRIHGYSRYSNIMLDHQTGELLPINQDNFAPNLRNIASSIIGKSGSRNEYALVSFLRL